jgi:hypothetical protein
VVGISQQFKGVTTDMAILGSHGLSVHSPFTDAFDMTFPLERAHDVEALLRPHLLDVGASVEFPGCWRVPRLVQSLSGPPVASGGQRDTPTVRTKALPSVFSLGVSGGACASFRLLGIWNNLLADLWTIEHRVTRLHATADSPLSGPASIAAVVAAGRAGGLHLSRKALNPRHVKRYDELDARGECAGGVYLGNPKAEVRGLVYCKRNETESRGLPDPGPLTRTEIRLSIDGITLRDVSDPSAIFWHYAREILAPPPGVPDWIAGDTGFLIEPREERSLWDRLRLKVETWHDLLELGLLADQAGPYGRVGLLKLIASTLGVTIPVPAGAYWTPRAGVTS